MYTSNKSLEALIDSYYNPKADIYQDEATILAVKKALSYEPQEAIKYLEVDSVLDGMNYKKDFSKNKGQFEKYLNYALFDRHLPENKMGYLNNLKERSLIAERLIAAKIIDEDKNLSLDYLSSICTLDLEDETIYGIANIYLDSKECHVKETAIREAIFQTIRYATQEDSLKILGENPFLDSINLNKKIDRGRFDLFADEAKYLYKINPKSEREEFESVKSIVDNDTDCGYELVAERIRREYFPDSGFKVIEEDNYDFEDEDDE